MEVKLEASMYGIRRDGVRVGPVVVRDQDVRERFSVGGYLYRGNGGLFYATEENNLDIIAAGYLWSELGAQVGDTVHMVWCGDCDEPHGSWGPFVVDKSDVPNEHPDSLFVIVKRAEPEIEWGDWVDGPCTNVNKNRQNQWINGKWQHRFEKVKIPVIKTEEQYMYFDGTDYKIKLTKVDDVATVEIVQQKDYS